jgi:hypothetical protein
MRKRDQHIFIPFVFDTFDFLIPEAVDILKRVQRIMYNNVVSHKSQDVVFTKIEFVIQKELTVQLIIHLPFIKV